MDANTLEEVGARRELFVDEHLFAETRGNARLKLHAPRPRGTVLVLDRPWEGNSSGYFTVFRDGPRVLMYYRGSGRADGDAARPETACLAESEDGIAWRRPALGLAEFQGGRVNNIMHAGVGAHNFTPFLDTNPACPPDQRFKAFASSKPSPREGLYNYVSPDGVRWRHPRPDPVAIPVSEGSFDSQNLAFWDQVRGEYRAYHRFYHEGVRGIKTARSANFLDWEKSEPLEFPGAPVEHLYTNQVAPYFRAPHIFVGFPTRLLPERGSATEGLFMSSRDGKVFRRWGEALLRPGPNPDRWANRGNYIYHGLVETPADEPGAPAELSIYSGEKQGNLSTLRRYAFRLDGFVSLNAPLSGGELVTRPLRFAGARLEINYASSAAGGVRVEVQDAGGVPLPGHALADCRELWGDEVARTVRWGEDDCPDIPADRPVRLRFALRDADVFSFRFAAATAEEEK